mmetsp:Transcript_16399/g.47089  ORF Transcript_16399/g.47089 Transcript_16399/m.47089 type:complete len:338 (+) Transcript_16399:750-1763(+)
MMKKIGPANLSNDKKSFFRGSEMNGGSSSFLPKSFCSDALAARTSGPLLDICLFARSANALALADGLNAAANSEAKEVVRISPFWALSRAIMNCSLLERPIVLDLFVAGAFISLFSSALTSSNSMRSADVVLAALAASFWRFALDPTTPSPSGNIGSASGGLAVSSATLRPAMFTRPSRHIFSSLSLAACFFHLINFRNTAERSMEQLTTLAAAVAIAAPRIPIPSFTTRSQSPKMFVKDVKITASTGVFKSRVASNTLWETISSTARTPMDDRMRAYSNAAFTTLVLTAADPATAAAVLPAAAAAESPTMLERTCAPKPQTNVVISMPITTATPST